MLRTPTFHELGVAAVACLIIDDQHPEKVVDLARLLEERLDVSMQVVMRAVSRVEKFNGTTLFNRGKYIRPKLNDAGTAFLAKMRPAIGPFLDVLEQGPLDDAAIPQKITLLTENLFAVNLLPDVLTEFWKTLPDDAPRIRFDVREVSSYAEGLQQHRDPTVSMLLCLVRGKRPPTPEHVKVSGPLMKPEYVALIPKTDEFRKYAEPPRTLPLESLADARICFVGEQGMLMELLGSSRTQRLASFDSLASVRQTALTQELIGLVVNWKKFLGNDWSKFCNLRKVEVKREPMQVRLYERKKPPLSKWEKKFRNFLREAVAAELLEPFDKNGQPVTSED